MTSRYLRIDNDPDATDWHVINLRRRGYSAYSEIENGQVMLVTDHPDPGISYQWQNRQDPPPAPAARTFDERPADRYAVWFYHRSDNSPSLCSTHQTKTGARHELKRQRAIHDNTIGALDSRTDPHDRDRVNYYDEAGQWTYSHYIDSVDHADRYLEPDPIPADDASAVPAQDAPADDASATPAQDASPEPDPYMAVHRRFWRRNQDQIIDAHLAQLNLLREQLARIQSWVDDNGETPPDDLTWPHVGTTAEAAQQAKQLAAMLYNED